MGRNARKNINKKRGGRMNVYITQRRTFRESVTACYKKNGLLKTIYKFCIGGFLEREEKPNLEVVESLIKEGKYKSPKPASSRISNSGEFFKPSKHFLAELEKSRNKKKES